MDPLYPSKTQSTQPVSHAQVWGKQNPVDVKAALKIGKSLPAAVMSDRRRLIVCASRRWPTLRRSEHLVLCCFLSEHLIKVRLQHGVVLANSDSLVLNYAHRQTVQSKGSSKPRWKTPDCLPHTRTLPQQCFGQTPLVGAVAPAQTHVHERP